MEDSEIKQLLTEIRDAQRDLTAEYRRVANESVQIQRQAFEMQSRAIGQQATAVRNQLQNSRLYRVVLVVGAVVIAGLLFWLFKLSR